MGLLNMDKALAKALKTLVEQIKPDLRSHMRLSLLGKVAAVNEDDYRVDVVVEDIRRVDEAGDTGGVASDDSGNSDDSDGSNKPDTNTMDLPNLPVSSFFAQDGYGIWALPEVGAEVTVSFYEGDVTRPYVEAPVFYNNRVPDGFKGDSFKAGTIAIVGKQGQKLIVKPDSSEVVVMADSIKTIITGSKQSTVTGDSQEMTSGTQRNTVGRDRKIKVDGSQLFESKKYFGTVKGWSQEQYNSRRVKIRGEEEHTCLGNSSVTIGGSLNHKVLGTTQTATVGPKQEIIGGAYSMVVANGPTPQPNAWSVDAAMGNISINTMAGQIKIGGKSAISPAVLGTELVASLQALIQIFTSNAAAITGPCSVGSPAQLSPAVVTALSSWAGSLANILSQCVMLKKLPAG